PREDQRFAKSNTALLPDSRNREEKSQREQDADRQDQLRLAMQVVTPTAITVEVEHPRGAQQRFPEDAHRVRVGKDRDLRSAPDEIRAVDQEVDPDGQRDNERDAQPDGAKLDRSFSESVAAAFPQQIEPNKDQQRRKAKCDVRVKPDAVDRATE